MDQVAPLAAHVQELWRRVESILGEVRDQAKPVPLAVLVIPTSIHVIPGHYELFLGSALTGLDPTRCRRGEAQRRLVAICKRLGVPAFDLTRLLADDPDPASNWLTLDRHLSPRGHRTVARWLRPRLAALLED